MRKLEKEGRGKGRNKKERRRQGILYSQSVSRNEIIIS
jgi:hypothetical protein